jgi:RNA polymerase sigma factor (sigma-70 family)
VHRYIIGVDARLSMTLPPFQALLEAHGREVHRFLVATVGRSDADDCYQETWLAALRAYPRLRDARNLRGWIFTVAHRKSIDHIRSRRRRPIPVEEVPERAPVSADDGQPEVWTLVQRLPTKQRSAIALRFLADASHAQIAEVMGTSEEAARRNLHEGLKRLRTEHRDG